MRLQSMIMLLQSEVMRLQSMIMLFNSEVMRLQSMIMLFPNDTYNVSTTVSVIILIQGKIMVCVFDNAASEWNNTAA